MDYIVLADPFVRQGRRYRVVASSTHLKVLAFARKASGTRVVSMLILRDQERLAIIIKN